MCLFFYVHHIILSSFTSWFLDDPADSTTLDFLIWFTLLPFQGSSQTDKAYFEICPWLNDHVSHAVSARDGTICLAEVSNNSVPVWLPFAIWLTDWAPSPLLKDGIKQIRSPAWQPRIVSVAWWSQTQHAAEEDIRRHFLPFVFCTANSIQLSNHLSSGAFFTWTLFSLIMKK